MVTVREITAKTILTKSGIPGAEYVINPYVGCAHECLYCYARFMKRFSHHPEPWGRFVDARINAPELVPRKPGKYGSSVMLSSVTDCYQPLERKYRLTGKVLEKLLYLQPRLNILTKSDLVTRDIELLKQFRDLTVSFSLSTPDDAIARQVEPGAAPPSRRFDALRVLHEAGIHTVIFVSPILPEITDWRTIIEKGRGIADEFWFENLNLYPAAREQLFRWFAARDPELIAKYRSIYSPASIYWDMEADAIRDYCQENSLDCSIYFHHSHR